MLRKKNEYEIVNCCWNPVIGIVEVEHYNFEPLESVKQSLEFLKAAEYIDLY